MTRREIEATYPDVPLMFMDGFDDCIVGVAWKFAMPSVAYDKELVIQKLMEDGMDMDEAEEYHDFNQAGSYVGDHTPIFIEF